MPRIDEFVTAARRWTERKLPWYDPERHATVAAEQIEVIASARADERHAKRNLEAYRHVIQARRK